MEKIYKVGFFIFLISTLTFLNLWQVTKNGCRKDNSKIKKLNERRITSLFSSNLLEFRKIKSISGQNILTNKLNRDLLKGTTLAILLADFKCNKCQEKELKRIDELKDEAKAGSIKIIGITTKTKKNQVAIQRNILKLNLPIYWVEDELFKKEISFSSEYPQVIYVKDNVLLSSFVPVPSDDEFSKMFYSVILKRMINSF